MEARISSGASGVRDESRSARIAVNSVWVGLDNILSALAALFASILVARFYGPKMVGNYAFVMWLVFLAATFGRLGGMAVAARKFLAERIAVRDYAGAWSITRRLQRMQLGLCLMCLAIGAGILCFTTEPAFYWPGTLGLLSVVPSMFMAIATGANAALEDFVSNIKASVCSNIVNIGGIVIAVALHGTLTWLVAVLLVSRISDFVVRDWYRRRNYRLFFSTIDRRRAIDPGVEVRLKQEVWAFFLQTALLELLTLVVWDRSELFFLKYVGPVEQVAFYSLPFSIVMQLDIVPRVLFISSSTALIHQHAADPEQAKRMVATMVRLIALVTLPLTLGIAALAGPLILSIYGKAYVSAIPVLALMGIFGVARPFLLPARSYLVALSRQNLMTAALLLGSVIDLTFMALLIPRLGAVGAAWSNGLAQTAGVALTWWFVSRRTALSLNLSTIVRALGSAVAMAAGVWWLTRYLTPAAALVAGPIVGAFLYAGFLRLSGAVRPDDRDRLLSIASKVPGPIRLVFCRLVRLTSSPAEATAAD